MQSPVSTLRVVTLDKPGRCRAEDGFGENGEETVESVHAKFLALVHRLVTNKLDSSAFEDECRAMLGANGYVLFTLDKLVVKMTKLVSTLLAVRPDPPLFMRK